MSGSGKLWFEIHRWVVVIDGGHQSAAGPFTSREMASELADRLRTKGVPCEVVELNTAQNVTGFYLREDAQSE